MNMEIINIHMKLQGNHLNVQSTNMKKNIKCHHSPFSPDVRILSFTADSMATKLKKKNLLAEDKKKSIEIFLLDLI